jgi:hypothetical protein
MKHTERTSFSERLTSAAAAKSELLAKLRPRPTVANSAPIDRAAERRAELDLVRAARIAAKAAKAQALADEEQARQALAASLEATNLAEKRGERKERKALTKEQAKAKRDARYAARKAR